MLATAGGAALVFAMTYLGVSAMTADDPSPLRPAATTAVVTPTPPGLAAPTSEPPPSSAITRPPATADPEALQPAGTPEGPDHPGELPPFDPADLIFGGTGSAGAILAGPGIVASSGQDARTPWELLIPSARLHAAIVAVGLSLTNALGAPDNPSVIGWWADGPAPGEVGNVLLDGHRDYRDLDGNVGTGVCWLLPETAVGDAILVRDTAATVTYLYTVIATVGVPWDSDEGRAYLRRSARALLTLITCEGSFDSDGRSYADRRIVVAELEYAVPFN